MADVQWFQIRSWDVLSLVSRGNMPKGLCGKWGKADAAIFDNLGSAKSCETCLRILARREDVQ